MLVLQWPLSQSFTVCNVDSGGVNNLLCHYIGSPQHLTIHQA